MGAFASPEGYYAAVASGRHDPRLKMMSLAGENVPSDGGFFVPTQVLARVLDLSLENEIVRPRADIQPMTGRTAVAPGFDDTDHSKNLCGGISGGWLGEGVAGTVQQPLVRLMQLVARKMMLLAQVSNELLADTPYVDQLEPALAKAVGFFLDQAFLNGTGSTQPLGVLG